MNKVVTSKTEGAPVMEIPQEIPRPEWLRRLDLFSAQHRGWRSKLDIIPATGEGRTEAHDLPFEGINIDQRGTDIVEITLEKDPNDRIVHLITHAKSISLRNPDEIEIQSDEGKTVLQCQPPEAL